MEGENVVSYGHLPPPVIGSKNINFKYILGTIIPKNLRINDVDQFQL